MITLTDRQQMQSDLLRIQQDNEVEIKVRRGQTTLPIQKVRIAKGGGGQAGRSDSQGIQAILSFVTVLGPVDLDLRPGDRFTTGSSVYEVRSLHPNRMVATIAEATLIQ